MVDTIGRLLAKWDGTLGDRTFARQSLRFPWMATLQDELATLSRSHGPWRKAIEEYLATNKPAPK